MTHREIRKRFLNFFEKRGHKTIPSASLVPENDPSALFISAGMQPLVSYLKGEKHPAGTRLASVQKSLRTSDIESVGDNRHLTFFQMLGNWSLGDYFKEDAIGWSYELLTDKEAGFGLDPQRLYITCFEGNSDAPKDEKSAEIWQGVGISKDRIYFMSGEDNWWPPPKAGDLYSGPAGPDSEMFYDITPNGLGDLSRDEFIKANNDGRVVEIWNDVFMEYEKKDGKVAGLLPQQNVDTGAGLERLATVLQGKDNVYDTDLFLPIMEKVTELSNKDDLRAKRIIADHIRSAVFVIADGVNPSNTERGYVLRRLIRRAVRQADLLEVKEGGLIEVAGLIIDEYGSMYHNLFEERERIKEEIQKEAEKFRKTLNKGLKELQKLSGHITARQAFDLYQTYGFPVEMTEEIMSENGSSVDLEGFKKELNRHAEISSTAAKGKFKGGLSGHGEMEVKYHTATHLLLAALRQVLGNHVSQRGSNITDERLRFDFNHDQKLTDEEKQRVEELINQKIKENLKVSWVEMSLDESREAGAQGAFGEKYGERVKVYKIGQGEKTFSKEICGGPHVENIGLLGKFKITKEESSSQGVRRIKAVLT